MITVHHHEPTLLEPDSPKHVTKERYPNYAVVICHDCRLEAQFHLLKLECKYLKFWANGKAQLAQALPNWTEAARLWFASRTCNSCRDHLETTTTASAKVIAQRIAEVRGAIAHGRYIINKQDK